MKTGNIKEMRKEDSSDFTENQKIETLRDAT